jgi:membrane associated rhomboid family serine protease
MPEVTKWLLFLNMGGYLLQMFFGTTLVAHFALWPLGDYPAQGLDYTVGFEPWQLVTYAFLHSGMTHLFLNMLALYMFGGEVENHMGSRSFLALYAGSVLMAALIQLAVVTAGADESVHPTVGASGGVFGLLLAFGMLFPDRLVMPLFPPIPMKAKYFVVLYGAIELANGVVGTREGIAHFAHLGGMLGGFLVLWVWRRKSRPRSPWTRYP